MICISINQESRRMALADMLNAASQCDLLEVRLDRFTKAPDVSELLAHKPKPVIFSCRRSQDGGAWEDTETDRLALLRQCIISKADYVEIELDAADQIRKFPPTKRVISYTNLTETPRDIAGVYAEAQTKDPDVIKLVTLARTPEEAWPLVQVLGKATVPTVVVGLGKPGVMLTVLGKKIGAPWTYAALERGMEAYPDQPTVSDLENVYRYREIDASTRLIGVTGFGEQEYLTVGVLNAGLAHLGLPARCLPLTVGSVSLFRKIVEAVKVAGIVVDEEHRGRVTGMATQLDEAAQETKAADLLLHKPEGWHGYNTSFRAAVAALEAGKPLQSRIVVVVGTNPTAKTMAAGIKERGGLVIVASHDRDAANALAQAVGCRQIQFEAVYSTMHDVVVVCDHEREQTKSKSTLETGLLPSYLRPGMTVMDLTVAARDSAFLAEARLRRCRVVSPRELLLEQFRLQTRLLTGKDVPAEPLQAALAGLVPEED
ncbi:MAG TPA: type I 3-dehydroquinate dehydratase [Gemmataceae bacterium]|nr:type I 3-dehydroquinate dehydratase [Gemmataceae bacterium]